MDDIIDLPSLAAELLDRARESSSGRAAKQVYAVGPLRAVVIGLTEGGQLAEHNAPPAATLQCVTGNARLVAGDRSWVLKAEGEVRSSRLALAALTLAVMEQGLGLLGVETPHEM